MITPETTIAELVNELPATIAVLQRHHIEFCCAGRVPIRDVCSHEQIDLEGLIAELSRATAGEVERDDWDRAPLEDLIRHILIRYHAHHTEDLPRLGAMLQKVARRHSDRAGDTLAKLQSVFGFLADALTHHMQREESVLFPAVFAAHADPGGDTAQRFPFREAIDAMERDHRRIDWAVGQIRTLTDRYNPPDGSCATYRGLYFGLGDLERRLADHVHLEDDILFRRALGLPPRTRASGAAGVEHSGPEGVQTPR